MLSADALFCAVTRPEMAPPPGFQPSDSVTDLNFLEPPDGATELAVLVPGWHQNERLQAHIARRQLEAGRATLLVGLNNGFLSTDPDRTVQSFDAIADRVGEAVMDSGYDTVHWHAASIGGAVALHAIGEQKLPAASLSLITPGYCIATGVWEGLRTRPLREEFEQRGVSLEALRRAWEHISPLRHAKEHIRDTRAHLVISQADRVIPPHHGEALATELERQGNEVQVTYNRRKGHYITIAHSAFRGVGIHPTLSGA